MRKMLHVSGSYLLADCVCVLSRVLLFGSPWTRGLLGPHGLGSSVHGIFQARIPEWVAISFPRESSRPRDPIYIS